MKTALNQRYIFPIVIGVSLLSSGCLAKIKYLPAQGSGAPVFESSIKDPDLIVGLAVSGGGSRAAAFTAATLEALAKLQTSDGKKNSVLERVNYISSVSGGSLASAYYVANKPLKKEGPMLDEKGNLSPIYKDFFDEYQSNMQKNFQLRAGIRQVLFLRAFNPTKFAYSLSDVLDSNFFHEKTFSDLYDREQFGDSPRLILNGTRYNDGRRFVLTTMSSQDFNYNFFQPLKDAMEAGQMGDKISAEEKQGMKLINKAWEQLLPATFEEMKENHRTLPISLAVATSASFPPVIGPVTYSVKGEKKYNHIGDGGLFDNTGLESLVTAFLKKISNDKSSKKALIIAIDAAYPFSTGNAKLDQEKKGFKVFVEQPSRIADIMGQRANAYQGTLWNMLRSRGGMVPDADHLKILSLKHTDAEWAVGEAVPKPCQDKFGEKVARKEVGDAIRVEVSQIPTLFKVDSCHGALLAIAAQKVVDKNKEAILGFLASR